MALTQTIGSLLHSDQLRSLRDQAEALMSSKGAQAKPEREDSPAQAQGLLGYLPMIMEYAGLFAEYLRPRTDQPVKVPAQHERNRVSTLTAARPYILATVAFAAFGYAVYSLARYQSARR